MDVQSGFLVALAAHCLYQWHNFHTCYIKILDHFPVFIVPMLINFFTIACMKLLTSGCLRALWKHMILPIISVWNAMGSCILSCSWNSASCLSSSSIFGEWSIWNVDEKDMWNGKPKKSCWMADCCIIVLILLVFPWKLLSVFTKLQSLMVCFLWRLRCSYRYPPAMMVFSQNITKERNQVGFHGLTWCLRGFKCCGLIAVLKIVWHIACCFRYFNIIFFMSHIILL